MRDPERTNRRNGYRHRDLDTRIGALDVAIPKLLQDSYFPDRLLERWRRAEAALTSVVVTCYLLGVSTRRMDRLVQSLGITGLSKSQVSVMGPPATSTSWSPTSGNGRWTPASTRSWPLTHRNSLGSAGGAPDRGGAGLTVAARRSRPRRKGAPVSQVNPSPGILLYTRIKKSPFYYGSRRHGVAVYSVYNHHYHPRHYGDPFQEYWQLLEGVTLWDVGGAERQVEITGPDAFAFTNMLTPRNLSRCEVGQCKYAFITSQEGGIINDPVLLRLGESHFWLSLADTDVLLWAKGVAHNSGFDVQITEPDVGPIQIQGPRAKEVMTDLFGQDVLALGYYRLVRRELDGMELVISRTGYSGELGYELYLMNASRDGLKLWDTVLEAGEPHGLSPIGPCHIRRIEGGILAHGCDITIGENPYEVGYGYKWMVELEQDQDFIGREALRKISRQGVRRRLVGVEIAGQRLGAYNDGSMPDFFPVHRNGERIGKVTSACYSPRLDKNIGYAMVPVEYSEIGTELTVERPEESVQAVVADRVFVKPEKAEQHLSRPGPGEGG